MKLSFTFGNQKIFLKDNRNNYNRCKYSTVLFLYNTIKSVIYQIPVGGPGFGCED